MIYQTGIEIPDILVRKLEDQIVEKLDKAGFFYRIFSRIKSPESIKNKLEKKKESYEKDGKKMQDLFGIRVVLYFNDDIEICEQVISSDFTRIDDSIDRPDASTFEPIRTNIVYRVNEDIWSDLEGFLDVKNIDNTFELQLRTVFSEGWHEVEHDLRYKCKEEWVTYPSHSRNLNGLLATLETCDWSMLNLFSELAYTNYQNGLLVPMLRNKLRIRFNENSVDPQLETIFNENKELLKKILKLERKDLINLIIKVPLFSLSMNNIIYILNFFFLKDEKIQNLTPDILIKQFEELR